MFAAAVQTEMKRAGYAPASGLRAAVGFTVSEVDHSGRRTHSENVLTTGNSGGKFVTTDAAVRREVLTQLASDGVTQGGHGAVTLQSVTLFDGVDPAPIVRLRLRSNTPAARLTLESAGVSGGPRRDIEGYLFLVDGPGGTPIEALTPTWNAPPTGAAGLTRSTTTGTTAICCTRLRP